MHHAISAPERQSNNTTHLWQVAMRLSQVAFTDFDQAREALEELRADINQQSPFELRLLYYQHAAFLENQWNQYEKALENLEQVLHIRESLLEPIQLAETWSDAAGIYLNLRDWTTAQGCLDEARKYLKDQTNASVSANMACREGFLNLHLGYHRQALDNLLEARTQLSALSTEEASLKDYYILTLVLSGLGDLYERLGERDNSLDAYQRVLPIVERHRLKPRLAWHYLNAGRAALARSIPEEAQSCFENVLNHSGEGDQEAKAHALANLGILAYLKNDTEKAVALFDEAIGQFREPSKPSDFVNLSKIESWRASLFLRQNDPDAAEKHLKAAFKFGQKGFDIQHLRQICQMLAGLYARKKRYAQAYKWQRRMSELTEKHFEQVQDREREELAVRHQLERSRQESQMARLRVAGLQSRALRAQMNPHFLFNILNAIQGFITSGRDNEAATYLARFAKLMRQTLDYSDKEAVSLDEEIRFISQYLEINRKLRFRDKLNYEVVPPPQTDLDDLYVPTMIIQPFVENAIEHGLRPRQEGRLRITFHLSDDEQMLHCIIEDDGIGIKKGLEKQLESPEFQTHRSRGMDITHDRLTLLHRQHKTDATTFVKTIDLSDLPDSQRTGTRVEVLLPLLESDDPTAVSSMLRVRT